MRIFIRKKSNPIWLVYAIDKGTKQAAGFYIGRRTNKTLNAVVKALTNAKAEKIYTDKLKNYRYLIPKEIHEITALYLHILYRGFALTSLRSSFSNSFSRGIKSVLWINIRPSFVTSAYRGIDPRLKYSTRGWYLLMSLTILS